LKLLMLKIVFVSATYIGFPLIVRNCLKLVRVIMVFVSEIHSGVLFIVRNVFKLVRVKLVCVIVIQGVTGVTDHSSGGCSLC
jgi:hypothetical protein